MTRRSILRLPLMTCWILWSCSTTDQTGHGDSAAGSGVVDGGGAGQSDSGTDAAVSGSDGGAGTRDGGNVDAGDAGTAGALLWYRTCGDPVCQAGNSAMPGVRDCTTEKSGDPCSVDQDRCNTGACHVALLCTSTNPIGPWGCPISRREYKQDIQYLTPEAIEAYRQELLHLRLATWRYRHAPRRQHLGILLDDIDNQERSVAVDDGGRQVDLYGYASLAVATLQLQQRKIEVLEQEVRQLQQQLAQPRIPEPAQSCR
jgi:hypothetical protein